jgi:hypothetical protein
MYKTRSIESGIDLLKSLSEVFDLQTTLIVDALSLCVQDR